MGRASGTKSLVGFVAAALVGLVAAAPAGAAPAVTRAQAVHHDVSPPLHSITPAPAATNHRVLPLRPVPTHSTGQAQAGALQSASPSRQIPQPALNFDGIGNGFTGPGGTFAVNSAPPDPNSAVGPNHIFEIVNSDIAIFNKTGTAIFGPVATNTLWSGFGGGCQTNNDGDGSVSYDPIANRWVVQQFSVTGSGPGTPFLDCVAVSQTSDPTGAYNRYSFQYTNFPDYPKLSVWPDAYYITYNMFDPSGTTFTGGQACALDRAKMLTGAAATQQCFSVGTTYGGLLGSDLTGTTPPPAGSPNYVAALGSAANTLAYWKFHVDWTTPANTTLTGPTTLTTAAYSLPCGGSGGTCVPQLGTTQQLDTLGDRLMYRLAYRNFGNHESLVVNHSVSVGQGSVGVRWYELRPNASQNLSIFQQGTYAPDSSYRWMGSIAQDQSGDTALGFSVSSTNLHPQIHYTGRLASDAAGTMTQGEGTIINGAGSQSGSQRLARWGDYSSMAVDPTDGCTFYYTQQYIPSNGEFNWRTRIGAFKFPSCGATVANDFSISANPTSLSLVQGASGSSSISTALTSGSAQTVALSVSGVPSGATASLSPTSVTTGGSSTLTVGAGTAAVGNYTLTVTGTGTSATHTTTVSLNVTTASSGGIVNGGFETGTLSGWTASGAAASVISSGCHGGTYCGRAGSTSATNGDSNLAQTFTAPAGTTGLSLFYKSTCPDTITYDWATATLKDNTAGTTATILPKICTTNAWTQVTGSITAGHSYTLTLTSHDDNYSSDPTYTLFDDVTLTSAAPPPSGIANGGFETGSLSGWISSGASTSVFNSGCHAGTYCARDGSTSPTNGDSNIAQTFTVPSGKTTLSFFYKTTCPDTITYDWATATLKDNTAGTTTTILPKICTTNAWTLVTGAVTAGHSYTLTLTSHDDNYATDPTFTLFDDATLA